MRKHSFLSSIGFLSGVLGFLYIRYGSPYSENQPGAMKWVLSGLCGWLSIYLMHAVSQKLDKIFSWESMPGKRLLIGIILNSCLSFILIYLLLYLHAWVALEDLNFLDFANPIMIKLAIIIFVWVLLGSILYFALYSYYLYSQGQVNEVKRKRKQIELQLKALKNQLSPHFLFNNLNTISSLLYKDLDLAENFVRKLASSYHYTLKTYDKRLVSIEEELAFVRAYTYLLKTRFRNQLEINIDIPEQAKSRKIPPLALQMLVENAAKHNQMSFEDPLHVEITADKKWIHVSNNKTKTPAGISSFNIGLGNINSRFKLLANKEIVVENGQTFTVKLPLLN